MHHLTISFALYDPPHPHDVSYYFIFTVEETGNQRISFFIPSFLQKIQLIGCLQGASLLAACWG